MKVTWIILSEEGFTVAPNDSNTENLQVLGFVKASSADEAFNEFIQQEPHMIDNYEFDKVIAYPLLNNTPAIAYLSEYKEELV